MSRHYTHDSRSPTIAQTPSRNVPIRSTEAPASTSALPHLLDGLRRQMEDDRREQDLLVTNIKQMVKNVQRIRARQDQCWKHIQNALKDADADRPYEEDNLSSQESQTQLWAYPEDGDDEPFQPLSDAEDSLLGSSTQPEVRQSAASNARSMDVTKQSRGSTALYADNMLDSFAMDDIATDEDSNRNTTPPQTVPASEIPSPVTPGIRRYFAAGNTPRVVTAPVAAATLNPDASASSPPSPTAIAGPSTAAKAMPPPATPTTKGKKRKVPPSQAKRKRAIEKSFAPSASAEPRLKRVAASDAEKRNQVLFEFHRMNSREQSQALGDETKSPFYNCGNCGKLTCKKCAERKRRTEMVNTSRML